MNRDPFYYHLEELDDDLIQESADAKRNRWKTLLLAVGVIALVIVLVNLVLAIPAHEDAQNLGGEKGVLCDGVYYIYAGSGFAPPGEVRVPRGIFAYTPGQEPELLVSVEDYSLDTIFPSWDVSAQGLFFIDQSQNTLWRMDLETREVTLLYDMPEEEAPEGDVGLGEIVTCYGNGESSPAMEYNPYLFLDGLWEDHIALIANTGWETYDLVLDCRTGEVLSQEIRSQSEGWNLLAGDRLLKEYRMDYPEGTEYPGWEFDKKEGLYHYTDLRENGVSVLPEGMKGSAQEIGDGVLAVYQPLDQSGDRQGLLLLADGRNVDLVLDEGDVHDEYLAVSGNWLFYTEQQPNPTPGMSGSVSALWVMDLDTGERHLVEEKLYIYRAVTDGTWLYHYGSYTVCYRVEYDEAGVPCGLTLVESGI